MNQNWELPAKNVDSFIYERIILNRELLKSWWDSQLDQEKERERERLILLFTKHPHTLIRKYWLKKIETHSKHEPIFLLLVAVTVSGAHKRSVWNILVVLCAYALFAFVQIRAEKNGKRTENNNNNNNNANFQYTRQSFEFIIIDNLIDLFNQMAMWKKGRSCRRRRRRFFYWSIFICFIHLFA